MGKIIEEVLVCKPLYYSVEYVINPWMKPGSVDRNKALEQWEELINTYKRMGIKVHVIDQEPGVPDMVFAADQSIIKDSRVLLSNFRYPERRKEHIYYEKWFEDHGYNIEYLPEGVYLEGGGESVFYKDSMFLGVGFRSSPETPHYLAKFLGRDVIPLKLIDPYFYHLDTCLFILDESTAFYYPPAFSQVSINLMEEKIPNLIVFTPDEAADFCSNSVVSGKQVICQIGSPSFEEKLQKLGYQTTGVDVSEFIKSGGGIHCLTNILNSAW